MSTLAAIRRAQASRSSSTVDPPDAPEGCLSWRDFQRSGKSQSLDHARGSILLIRRQLWTLPEPHAKSDAVRKIWRHFFFLRARRCRLSKSISRLRLNPVARGRTCVHWIEVQLEVIMVQTRLYLPVVSDIFF